MKWIFLFLLQLLTIVGANAQKRDLKLSSILRKDIGGFQGNIGLYVKNLRNGTVVEISADTIFPTASIVKVAILLGIMDKMLKKEISYDSSYLYRDSLLYPGEDILGSFKDGEKISLKKIIMLMLTTSDNTASLWLQKIAGSGTRINFLLDSLGYKNTKINSRTPGREECKKIYGWGQSTPREMATVFEQIYKNQLFSPVACERMMRCLGRNFWDEDEGISQVPPYIEVLSKNGCIDASRNEIMLVNAPHNPYIVSVFTKNNKDQRWEHTNEAWALIRKISASLWDYFEPNDKWQKP
jgi:beta-lactamase class A